MFSGLICGPTGAGKSDIACEIAEANGFEIISADSRQIYKGFHIGTGTVSKTWQKRVPHHFINSIEPTSLYSVHQYCKDVMELIDQHPDKKFLVVGGTPLYIKGLLRYKKTVRGPVPKSIREEVQKILSERTSSDIHSQLLQWDPEVAKKIKPQDTFRLSKALENYLFTGKSYQEQNFPQELTKEFKGVPLIFLNPERETLYSDINSRVVKMFEKGWVDEVRQLLKVHGSPKAFNFNALGYQEIADFVLGKSPDLAENDLIAPIQKKTRNYAKKQVNFFKGQLKELFSCKNGDFKRNLKDCDFNWQKFKKNCENSLTY